MFDERIAPNPIEASLDSQDSHLEALFNTLIQKIDFLVKSKEGLFRFDNGITPELLLSVCDSIGLKYDSGKAKYAFEVEYTKDEIFSGFQEQFGSIPDSNGEYYFDIHNGITINFVVDQKNNEQIITETEALIDHALVHQSIAKILSRFIPDTDKQRQTPEITRYNLESGQLSILDSADDVQRKMLLEDHPWNNDDLKRKGLNTYRRKIEAIGETGQDGFVMVLKQSEFSGESIKNSDKRTIHINTPSSQLSVSEEAQSRYREIMGVDIPLEKMLGFYVDRETTNSYSFYSYHEPINFGDDFDEIDKIRREASRRVQVIDDVLAGVGVSRGETGNYLITQNPEDLDGITVVIIDTEMWSIDEE